jgi:acyl carrier protein
MDMSYDAAPGRLSIHALTIAVGDIWTATLGLSQPVDLDVNFFDAGGDSLRLLRLQNALNQKFALDLCGVDLFEHTTIRGLAAYIGTLQR